MFANIYLYLPLIFSIVSKRHVLSMINSDFSQKSFVMLCEECLQYIYLYLTLFSQLVSKRHVVEYDKLRFLYVKNARNHL